MKNYRDLANAESEKLNVNGKETGYHAATATVDDNGKIGTHSIHS